MISRIRSYFEVISKPDAGNDLDDLKREVEILKKLSHPNVVKFVEGFETGRRIYLVMEKCEGGDLLHRMAKQNHIRESDVKSYIAQLLDAVAYAHSNDVVHCILSNRFK